jgi:methylated-DNA-[protein]-cysteine S-methyltransferase
MASATFPSPFGPVTLHEQGGELDRLDWRGGGGDPTPLLAEAGRQLTAYFAGTLRTFDLPLATGKDPFLMALTNIPFGETRSYGDLARVLGLPAQAIGQMCGRNRLPIFIPCHRVLGRNTLGGFSAPGGIETKVALLRHEGAAGLLL